MTEAPVGTLIQYASELRRAYPAENPEVTAGEYDESYQPESRLLNWCAALYAAARRGETIPARTLDDLARRDRRFLNFLMSNFGGSIPAGYMSPDVRRQNRDHEAEMRAARQAGRQRAKGGEGDMRLKNVPGGWIPVGDDSYVRAADVVAVYDSATDDDQARMIVSPGDPYTVKATILLRGGQVLPAFHATGWIMERMRGAESD